MTSRNLSSSYFLTLSVWSPNPSWSNILSASSSTNTFTSDTSMTFLRIRSVIVPGVPTTMCAVIFVAPLGRLSLIAYSVWMGVNLPIAATTDIIWRANSLEGARQRAWNTQFRHKAAILIKAYLRLILREVNATQHRQDKRGSLSGPRLRLPNHVLRADARVGTGLNTLKQELTYGFASNRGRARSWILDGFENPRSYKPFRRSWCLYRGGLSAFSHLIKYTLTARALQRSLHYTEANLDRLVDLRGWPRGAISSELSESTSRKLPDAKLTYGDFKCWLYKIRWGCCKRCFRDTQLDIE